MFRKIFEVSKKEDGFTLLELLVVVAVIGLLAAIIVPQVGDVTDDAQLASVRANLSSMQSAIERFKLSTENTDYPTSLEDLGVNVSVEYEYSTDGNNYLLVYGETFTFGEGETATEEYLYVENSASGIQSDVTKPTEI